ncbi:hypothetical protein [Deinococcus sp. QL22]|uniref:hypothetical protein n=1 Tax=Deinococcus sp. QL22 TaxID=2939437 RepID=UPI0020174A0B|nr:hypothetical protein [Deinococcus sp. QL22]UQN05101.1 hypothetical protein M1R55_09310 [Deinococcus sp. QL22]
MWVRIGAVVLLSVGLVGCQDRQARSENARLAARLSALEQQVKALRQAQAKAPAASTPEGFMARAAAQNCANDLARTLETFRRDSIDGIYPTPARLMLPDSCIDQRVQWIRLTAQAYAFALTDEDGGVLARGSGP